MDMITINMITMDTIAMDTITDGTENFASVLSDDQQKNFASMLSDGITLLHVYVYTLYQIHVHLTMIYHFSRYICHC